MNRDFEAKRRLEKVVISGDTVEYIRYVNPISIEKREHDIIKNKETSYGKRDRNLIRARSDIRRIIMVQSVKIY